MKSVQLGLFVAIVLSFNGCLFFGSDSNTDPITDNISADTGDDANDDLVDGTCGNGVIEGSESCDITDYGGANCGSVEQGSSGGLGCNEDCTFNKDGCKLLPMGCGNDKLDAGEECEPGSIAENACERVVGPGSTGTPICSDCKFEVGTCTQVYKHISAGGLHTCALKYDDTVRCWGAGEVPKGEGNGQDDGQSIPPTTKFQSISAGGWHTCGIDFEGLVSCWGRPHGNGSAPPVGGFFTQVSAGVFHTCALLETGEVKCWGRDDSNYFGLPFILKVESVGSGRDRTCYLKEGLVSCITGGVGFSVGAYKSVNPGGGSMMCGLPSESNTNPCWGEARLGENMFANNPDELEAGGFKSVDAGRAHGCGIDQDNFVSCWGREDSFRGMPRDVEFREISVGDFHVCGLTQTGRTLCGGAVPPWSYGQTMVPSTTERLSELLDL